MFPLLGGMIGAGVGTDSAWRGWGIFLCGFLGLIPGAIVGVILMIVAYTKKLRHRWASLISGVPSAVFLLWAISKLGQI